MTTEMIKDSVLSIVNEYPNKKLFFLAPERKEFIEKIATWI